MRTLAFDGRMGASGDMLLGALLAVGADHDRLAPVEDAIDVEYRIERVTKNGIRATSVTVLATGDGDDDESEEWGGDDRSHSHDHEHGDGDGHDHANGHEHDRDHANGHEHHAEGHGPTRTYPEVAGIVEGMGLPGDVERNALATFRLLGEAEAAVHGTDLRETAFHEVGADDAIADVVGAHLLLDDLGVERVVTTPVATGGGEVTMSHGRYPVPTPAVVNLAERADWTLRGGPVEAELLTPTGAAILATVAGGVDSFPALRVDGSGYGAGGYTFEEHPNVLRATVGEAADGLAREGIRLLETNLDDATPETLGSLQETLSEEGALDVTVLPATMKKSRPGHLVKVVVDPADAERVARRLAEETGTLGVRDAGVRHRWTAERRVETATLLVDGERHRVRVKVASAGGAAYDVSAEHDDALAVARETDLPVRDARRRAEAAVRDGGGTDDRLVHLVERDRWEAVEDGDAYRPASLDEEGFVHLSPVDRVLGVAEAGYADADDPVLLVVDRAALDAEVRYEEVPDGRFPHLYGPLGPDAVEQVLELTREDGRYVLPELLR